MRTAFPWLLNYRLLGGEDDAAQLPPVPVERGAAVAEYNRLQSVKSVDSFLDCQVELTQNPNLSQLPVPHNR
jgi:hypothetical protein